MNENSPSSGKVTIGIPVYNEAAHIEKSILSAVGQADYLLISDNASSDGTSDRCNKLECKLPNIELFAHPKNQGALYNFKFLLDRCQTEYFMWLGAHDHLPSDYITLLKTELESDPTLVLAYGKACHVDLSNNEIIHYYNYPALSEQLNRNDVDSRALSLICSLSDCSLVHGLWRTEALRNAWVNEQLLGADHVLLLKAALNGRFKYVQEAVYKRGHPNRVDTKVKQMQRITGKKEKTASLVRLCELSLESLNQSQELSQPRVTYIKAYLLLAYRFGAFSKNPIFRFFQHSIHLLRGFVDFARSRIA